MPTFGTSLLLKNKQAVFASQQSSSVWKKFFIEFFLVGLFGIAIFGGVSSITFGWKRIWELSWKYTVVYWDSMLICFPSLYVFSVIRGSRITFPELVYYVFAGMATIGVLLLSLAPITGFFAWTSKTPGSMYVINVAVGGLAMLFGIYVIGRGYAYIYNIRKSSDPQSKSGLDFLVLWFILLIAVMIQMGVTLKI